MYRLRLAALVAPHLPACTSRRGLTSTFNNTQDAGAAVPSFVSADAIDNEASRPRIFGPRADPSASVSSDPAAGSHRPRQSTKRAAPRVVVGPAVCASLAEAHARVQAFWEAEMCVRARAFDQFRRTHGRRRHHRSADAAPLLQRQAIASYLATTTIAAVHTWWQTCTEQVWLPHDVLHACSDAPRFVLDLVRQATSSQASVSSSLARSSPEARNPQTDWRARFQRLSDDALLTEFDEWLLLHAPPTSASTRGEPSGGEEDEVLSFPQFLSLLASYLRYHQGVAWGASRSGSGGRRGPRSGSAAADAYDRRAYRLHPWASQYCPEGRAAQMPFVHTLQWMLAREQPHERDDAARTLWERFRALEPFRPPSRTAPDGTGSVGFTALDVGSQSGFATDLLLTAGAGYVLAVDPSTVALDSTESTVHDHMQREKSAHGREVAAQHQLVQVQQCALLPAAPTDIHVVDITTPARTTAVQGEAKDAFAQAAQRRRDQARAQRTHYAEAASSDVASHTATRDIRGEGRAPFDVVYYHPPCPSLWPVETLAESRPGIRVGDLSHASLDWWRRAIVRADGERQTDETEETELDAVSMVLPWMLSPTAQPMAWLALPDADPIAGTHAHARLASPSPVTSWSSIHQLVEELTIDVVQRSAQWSAEGSDQTVLSSPTSTSSPSVTQRKVVRRARPLVREDGYVVLVLPRTLDGEDVLRVLQDEGAALTGGSVADYVLAALEGLYEPVLRRAYVPSATPENVTVPKLVRQALSAIDGETQGTSGGDAEEAAAEANEVGDRRSTRTTPRRTSAHAAAVLLHAAERATRTVDVLVLRKNSAACVRARAAAATLSAESGASHRRETAQVELRQALAMYERLTHAGKRGSEANQRGGDANTDRIACDPSSPGVAWRDSFEHNEYKPRSAPTTRYHWTDLVPTYSYLETDYYGCAGQENTSGSASGLSAHDVTSNFLAVGHPPSLWQRAAPLDGDSGSASAAMDAQTRIESAARFGTRAAPNEQDGARPTTGSEGSRSADGAARTHQMNTVMHASETFRAIFAEELRQKRRGKMRKLALSPIEQQEWYVDAKLLKSGAAKVELMNELSRWDLKDYD